MCHPYIESGATTLSDGAKEPVDQSVVFFECSAITKVRESVGSEVRRSATSFNSSLSKKPKDKSTSMGVTTPSTSTGTTRETSSSSHAQRTKRDGHLLEQRAGKTTVTIALRDDIPLNTLQVGCTSLRSLPFLVY